MVDYRENNIWNVYIHIIPKSITKYNFDKYYVGITSRTPQKRWKNGRGYKTQLYFYNAILKYGWDNIIHEIIANNLTYDEACNMEELLIKKLSSNDKIHGYNLTDGGKCNSGYKFSEEQREEMSKNRCGENNAFFGKKHSDDARRKMRENNSHLVGEKNGRAKPIYVFTLEGDFIEKYPSTVEASKDLNIKNWIATSASHKTSCQGYLFAREDNIYQKDDDIFLKNIDDYKIVTKTRQYKNRSAIALLDKDFNIIATYKNTTDAHLETGVSVSTIIYQADHKNLSVEGKYWRWCTDLNENFRDSNESLFY